jgi:hypothetical protein
MPALSPSDLVQSVIDALDELVFVPINFWRTV